VGWLTRHPQLFLRGLWAYFFTLMLRMAAIWLVPLSPPVAILAMPDPFLAQLFHTAASEAITKDLFFSGHTSTVAVLALAVRGWLRPVLLLAMVAVGVLVLVQRGCAAFCLASLLGGRPAGRPRRAVVSPLRFTNYISA
jgi:hypothetical protein